MVMVWRLVSSGARKPSSSHRDHENFLHSVVAGCGIDIPPIVAILAIVRFTSSQKLNTQLILKVADQSPIKALLKEQKLKFISQNRCIVVVLLHTGRDLGLRLILQIL